jgi:hypothetical protein
LVPLTNAGVILCLVLQGLQMLIAPFLIQLGRQEQGLLAALALYTWAICIGILSLRNHHRLATMMAVLYGLASSYLWWRYLYAGGLRNTDLDWMLFPPLAFVLCIFIKAATYAAKPEDFVAEN